MPLEKDFLAGSVRIKKRFAASPERLRIARNRIIAAAILLLAIALLTLLFRWLES